LPTLTTDLAKMLSLGNRIAPTENELSCSIKDSLGLIGLLHPRKQGYNRKARNTHRFVFEEIRNSLLGSLPDGMIESFAINPDL
jgi:hypothetical protein